MKSIFFKTSLVLCFILIGEMLTAQSCSTGTIFITSQAELNDFVVTYGACDSIVPGTKLIIDDTANDITDLTPLSNLVYIAWLEIYRTDITTLAGLENISQTTMSKCIIVDNPLLTDISQLTGLTPGAGALTISGSPLLNDLTGIDNNTIIGTSLTLKNLGITSLNDLAITRIDGYLTIEDNVALVDISSLNSLTDFGGGANGGFNVRNNSLLDDCSSICSLVKNLLPIRPQVIVDISGNLGNCIDEATVIANCGRTPCDQTDITIASQARVNSFQVDHGPCDSITGTLFINDSNVNLTDLSRLSTLETVGGININSNTLLTDLSGLDNLEVRSLGNIIIANNDILTDVSQLSNIGPNVNQIYIAGNPLLTDLSVVQNISTLARLRINDMDGLTNLDDFSSITNIFLEYNLSNNANLTDISGLSSFAFGTAFSPKIFRIENNPLISDCSSICPIVKITLPALDNLTTTIQNNIGDCIDEATILSNCGRTPCNQTSAFLTSQLDVTTFQNVYGPCDSIAIRLDISGGDISDLTTLNAIEYSQQLWITNSPVLTTLDGLGGLNQNGLSVLAITNNAQLSDLSALSGIGQNIGTFVVENCPKLTDLSIFNNHTLINEFTIRNMPGIVNLDAFSNVTDIARTLVIQNNTSLNGISGLGSVSNYGTAASGFFIIEDNPMLFDCSPVCGIVTDILPTLSNWNVMIQNNLGPCVDEQTVVNTCCDHPDYAALEAFYYATSGDSWSDNTGWLTDCDPCGVNSGTPWIGIQCTPDNRIKVIDLVNALVYGLAGTIPREIGDLDSLEILYLVGADSFSGTSIPDEICNLVNLRLLQLGNMELEGQIPACIANLTKLEGLFLQENKLSGPIPDLSNSPSLSQLQLYNNNFSGTLPLLGNLPNLTNLQLTGNNFIGHWPESYIPFCTQLFTYNFNRNNYDGVSDFISNLGYDEFCGDEIGRASCGGTGTRDDYAVILDSGFEQVLIDQGIDSEGTLEGCILRSDIESISVLDIRNANISDLTGIHEFKALERLIIDDNNITGIDLRGNVELVYVKG